MPSLSRFGREAGAGENSPPDCLARRHEGPRPQVASSPRWRIPAGDRLVIPHRVPEGVDTGTAGRGTGDVLPSDHEDGTREQMVSGVVHRTSVPKGVHPRVSTRGQSSPPPKRALAVRPDQTAGLAASRGRASSPTPPHRRAYPLLASGERREDLHSVGCTSSACGELRWAATKLN